MNIMKDVATAAKTFCTIREARKAGADGVEIQVKTTRWFPIVDIGYWGQTMEGCTLFGKKWDPVYNVFNSFSRETQHALCFTPKEHGEWVARARSGRST